MLTDLPEQHRELITADEVLRNKFAYAVRSLDAKDTLGIGQYIEAPEYEPKDARVAQHSEQLYEAGERVDSGFQATMQALALELGLSYQVGPVKKSSRIAEKAVVEEGLNGDSTQEKIENVVWQDVKDTVRGRFLVDDPRRIDELARGVQEAYEVLRTKSTLPTSRETGEVSLRGNKYMDTKFTLGVDDSQTGRRVKAEVAICTPEMAAATIAEHPVFEIIRSLDDRDARQVQLKAQLQKMSRDFFMAVSQQQADRLGEQ